MSGVQAKVLVVYVSGGGNTKEVAENISKTLDNSSTPHDIFRVGSDATLPILSDYGLVFLGSYTIGNGRTPEGMVNFLKEVGTKHPNVAVFGSGDSQWTYYCGAVDRLARFHTSPYPVLKIEQSPRGRPGEESLQEKSIKEWTSEVMQEWEQVL